MMKADDDPNDDETIVHNDVERLGYLQKKTSKGLWAARFFATNNRHLRYWHDREQYDKQMPACEEFDLAEISSIDKVDQKICRIKFLKNTKFQLTIKAETESELMEWMEIIRAKIKLYSVDELLADLAGDRVSFRTRTFQVLLLLSEKEQNKWILNRLDEAFESAHDDHHVMTLRSNPADLMKAACRAFDEFIDICIDCRQEMTSRSPRIIAHSRNYMQRYADILKGRTMLELLYIPGIENKKYELMGEKALCVALELAQKLETIKEFSFVPRAFLTTLMTSLFSFGDLLSALLNLALRRVDAFFEVLSTLPPELHARKISDGTSLISEFLVLVKEELKTDYLFSLVMEKAMTSLLLAFNDHLLSWDTSGYSETHFINHVQACDALQQGVQSLYIDLSQRKVLVADSAVVAENKEPNRLVVSAAVQDAVRCTCSSSAQIAVAQSVNRLQESKLYLVEGMLNEQNMAWINGSLIAAFVNNLDQWTNFICSTLPQRFTYMVYLQVSRLLIKIYLANMIAKHRSKSRLICTERGVAQMAQDLMAIKSWICTYESNMNTVTEQHLIVVLQSFLLCAQKDIVQAFSEAILFFGMKYAYHGYDLLRLVLKFRPDVHDIDRKALLGLCSEFIVQVQRAMQRDQFSFELPTQDMAILDELLPRVGVEHCTGRRWKVITLPDPRTVHLTLSLVVAETCNKALAARRKTDGRTAYQSRKVDGSLTLSLPKTSAKEKPWGESSGESTPSGAPAADHTETDGPSSAKARPPPPPPRRRATIATVDTATTPEPSPSLQATVSEDNAMKKVEGGVDGAEDRSSSAFARVEGTGEDQGERGVVSGQEETKSAHHVRHHRKPPPPPPPARPKTAVIHAAPPADALVENAQDVPPAPPIRHPSPAPPPKPARRASAPPIAPSLIASSSPPPPTSSSPSLSRPLTPQEALQLMLEAAKKNVAVALTDIQSPTPQS